MFILNCEISADNQGMRNFALLLIFMIVLSFQGCGGKVGFFTSEEDRDSKFKNGEGYGGKPTPYDFLDPKRVCADVGANGKPLPTSQIFVLSDKSVQLVREGCADTKPRTLAASEYSFAPNGDVVYQNQTFTRNTTQDPFDIVAATCPSGRTPLANPVRTSFLAEPLDLQAPVWESAGLAVTLEGALASLPLYQVQRNDPTMLEGWHRMAQSPILTSGEAYVFSFYAKPDSSARALFTSYYPGVQDFRIEFDLVTGAATVQSAVGVKLLSTKAQSFAGGLYINIYFESLNNTSANIGVASAGEFLGSSISMTALQFEQVSNFCSP